MKDLFKLKISKKEFIIFHALFVGLVLLDQLTKIIAIKYLQEPVIITSWLQLKLQINPGVAFSFLADAPQWISALISVIAFGAIEYYLLCKKGNDKVFNYSLVVLAAGALGNGIDRWLAVFGREIEVRGVMQAGVVDFIWPTFFANFNVADIYVTCTCIFMIIYVIFFGKEEKDPHRVKKSELKTSTNTEVKEETNNE